MSDIVLIISRLYCLPIGGSALVFGCASEKEKNNSVKLVSLIVQLYRKI